MGGWVDGWMGEVVKLFLCTLALLLFYFFSSLLDAFRLQNSFHVKLVGFLERSHISSMVKAIPKQLKQFRMVKDVRWRGVQPKSKER
jgi:hypothetical protein